MAFLCGRNLLLSVQITSENHRPHPLHTPDLPRQLEHPRPRPRVKPHLSRSRRPAPSNGEVQQSHPHVTRNTRPVRPIRNMGTRRNLRSYKSRAIRGESRSSDYRIKAYQEARIVRQELRPHRTQQEVADELHLTRSAIEWIELRALSKIIKAFRHARITS